MNPNHQAANRKEPKKTCKQDGCDDLIKLMKERMKENIEDGCIVDCRFDEPLTITSDNVTFNHCYIDTLIMQDGSLLSRFFNSVIQNIYYDVCKQDGCQNEFLNHTGLCYAHWLNTRPIKTGGGDES